MCSKPYCITAIYATITFFWFPLLLLPPFVLLLLPPFLFMVLRLLFLLLLARKRLQHHHLQQKKQKKKHHQHKTTTATRSNLILDVLGFRCCRVLPGARLEIQFVVDDETTADISSREESVPSAWVVRESALLSRNEWSLYMEIFCKSW